MIIHQTLPFGGMIGGMVAFYLPGNIPVYAFSILLAVSAAIGLAWVYWAAPEKEKAPCLDAGLWVLLGALAGGRLVYAAVNWVYFQAHPWEVLYVFQGGLSWPGALAGGLLALALYAWRASLPPGELADALLPLLAILAPVAWMGCWLDGCAYGWPSSAWWAIPARDEWGVISTRWPLQLLGALANLGLFWLLDWLAERVAFRPGAQAALGLLGFSLLTFGISFLRADLFLTWNGLRLDAWAALGLAFLAFCAFLVFQLRSRPQAESEP